MKGIRNAFMPIYREVEEGHVWEVDFSVETAERTDGGGRQDTKRGGSGRRRGRWRSGRASGGFFFFFFSERGVGREGAEGMGRSREGGGIVGRRAVGRKVVFFASFRRLVGGFSLIAALC